MYPSLIGFAVYVVVAWVFHGGRTPCGRREGFLLYGGALLMWR